MSVLSLYFDDTGSRHPDKQPDASRAGRDWFALGGFVIKQEDEAAAKRLHTDIVGRWPQIRGPFHITDMLAERQDFAWLGRLSDEARDRFWRDYKTFLATVPVLGLACVIDRPGYVARGYLQKHGNDRWLLCRSAFDILIERAAKLARLDGRKLRVIFEGDVGINETFKGYFQNLRTHGLGFDAGNSEKYQPLSQAQFSETLTTIEYKGKSSPLLQIADSYVYAMARAGYDRKFPIYRRLMDAKRIVNFALPNQHIAQMGVKYYCFELHRSNR